MKYFFLAFLFLTGCGVMSFNKTATVGACYLDLDKDTIAQVISISERTEDARTVEYKYISDDGDTDVRKRPDNSEDDKLQRTEGFRYKYPTEIDCGEFQSMELKLRIKEVTETVANKVEELESNILYLNRKIELLESDRLNGYKTKKTGTR